MIELLISDTQKLLNGLELMDEFKIHPDYGNVMLLNQLISDAKHRVEKMININHLDSQYAISNQSNQETPAIGS
jgi:hypothetical protein